VTNVLDYRPPLTAEDLRIHAWIDERLAVLHRERHGLWAKARRFLFGTGALLRKLKKKGRKSENSLDGATEGRLVFTNSAETSVPRPASLPTGVHPFHRPTPKAGEMAVTSHFDVTIIGGGTLAHHLAPSGKKILLLERGGWMTREPENWNAEEVCVKNRYVSAETWHDKNGKPFQPGVHYFVSVATKIYAVLSRLR
jgi:hypothetical protein